MMLISTSFRTVTDENTKDELFMQLEDYNVFIRCFSQMISVHCTSLCLSELITRYGVAEFPDFPFQITRFALFSRGLFFSFTNETRRSKT